MKLSFKAKASLSVMQIQHPVEGFESHMDRIRISFPKSDDVKKSVKGSKYLKRFESSIEGFESINVKFKQKVKERKRFKSPHKGSKSLIWKSEK